MSPKGKETLEQLINKLADVAAPKTRVETLYDEAARAAKKGDYEGAEISSGNATRMTRISRVVRDIAGETADYFQHRLAQEGFTDFDFPKLTVLGPDDIDPRKVKELPLGKRRAGRSSKQEDIKKPSLGKEEKKRISSTDVLNNDGTEIVLAGRMQTFAEELSTKTGFRGTRYGDPKVLKNELQSSLELIAEKRKNQVLEGFECKDAKQLTEKALLRASDEGLRGWGSHFTSSRNQTHESWRIFAESLTGIRPNERRDICQILSTQPKGYNQRFDYGVGDKVTK